MREGDIPARVDRARPEQTEHPPRHRYLHAARPSVSAAHRDRSAFSPLVTRLIPPFLLVTITAVVLLGGGFWPAVRSGTPIIGPNGEIIRNEGDIARLHGSVVPSEVSGDATDETTVDVNVSTPDGNTTTSLSVSANSSTFTGYFSRPGSIVTTIPQRVSMIPARRGETLETIADRLGSTATALMWANGITDPARVLPVGQTIRVPPPGTMLHRIKETDTLEGIARAYQVKTEQITAYPGNNVQQSSDLVPGAFLIIPTTNLPTRDHVVFYQVREGDSLSRISAIYALHDAMTLKWANNLSNADFVQPGQVIAIPPTDGIIHVVEPEDTQRTVDDAVTQIAKNFACAAIPCKDPPADARVNKVAADIFAFGGNHLTHGGRLVLGQEIIIPGGIPYVAPPPVIIPKNVTIDNPDTTTTVSTGAGSTVSSIQNDFAPGGNAAIVRVALRHLGEYRQPNGLPWAFWCEKFIGDVADQAGVPHYRYPTAIADAYNGALYRGRAPAGTLVFFDQSWNVAGHVGIAMGDGTMISALGSGVVRTYYEGSSGYMGWRPYS